jgi:hypothetical protein
MCIVAGSYRSRFCRGTTEDTEDTEESVTLTYEAAQPVFEQQAVEIDQQAHFETTQTEIGQHLSLLDRQEPLDRLDLDEELLLDHDVHPIAAIQLDGLVEDWQGHLSCISDYDALAQGTAMRKAHFSVSSVVPCLAADTIRSMKGLCYSALQVVPRRTRRALLDVSRSRFCRAPINQRNPA